MFNPKDYKGQQVAMHCKTEEEAKDFCRVLHENGYRWVSGLCLTKNTSWSNYGEDTHYDFSDKFGHFEITYSEGWYFRHNNYKILEWSDFMEKKLFTKADLQDGDFLVQRDGLTEVVNLRLGALLIKDGHWNNLDEIEDDLTNKYFEEYDIIKVYRPTNKSHFSFNYYENGDLVFDREKIKEISLADLEKQYGCKVKITK